MKSCLCCVKRHVGIVELPDTQRSASCRFQQDGAGKPLVISFVHAHVADRCEHDRTPLRGPYFTAVCPTSSRSASLHFQQRDGKTADRTETRRRTEESFWFFFSWLVSEDVRGENKENPGGGLGGTSQQVQMSRSCRLHLETHAREQRREAGSPHRLVDGVHC